MSPPPRATRRRSRSGGARAALVGLVALVGSVALVPPAVPAAPPAEWSTSVAQPTAIVSHAVALADGRILAVESRCTGALSGSCFELYDPGRDLWAPVISPEPNGSAHSIAALPNGHALVSFGTPDQNAGSLRRYRFDGVRWIFLGEPQPEEEGAMRGRGFTTTAMDPPACGQSQPPAGYPCGGVLFVGGYRFYGTYPTPPGEPSTWGPTWARSAHMYLDDDTFRPAQSMDDDRPGHRDAVAGLLEDGRVLVAGGSDGGTPQVTRSVDIFDPRGNNGLGTWTTGADTPSLQGGSSGSWAVRLHDGRLLVGGSAETLASAPVLFDPDGDDGVDGTVGSWAQLDGCDPPGDGPGEDQVLSEYRPCGSSAVVLDDGSVLAVGTPNGRDPAAWVLDPGNLAAGWQPLVPPPMTALSATLLGGDRCGANCGNVLVAGGHTEPAPPPLYSRGVGQASLFELFRLLTLSPTQGYTCGATPIEITGRGLGRVTAVNFGNSASVGPKSDAEPRGFTVSSDGRTLSLLAPPHPPGVAPVTLSTAGGSTRVDKGFTFTYGQAPPATITSMTGARGRWDHNTPVKIAGTFPEECVRGVRFGDAPAASYAVDSDGQVSATSPKLTVPPAGDVGVKVSVDVDPGPPAPAGTTLPSVATAPDADVFTYLAPPAISGLSPARGPATGGGKVVVSGTGLGGTTEVRFGDVRVPASGFSVNAAGTTITAILPGHDPGDVGVTLTTPERGQSVASPASQFTYHPGISGLFPPSGPLTGGTDVTIAGRGFTGVGDVQFGATSVAPVSVTDTEIVVRSPAHPAAEAVPVRLVASGLSSLPEDVLFTYGLANVAGGGGPEGDLGAGPPRQDTTPIEPAPPGGTGSPSPAPAPLPAQAPAPAQVTSPVQAPSPGLAPGQAPSPGPAPGQAASQVSSPAGAVPPLAPVAGAAPAPATAQAAPGSAQAGAASGQDEEQARGSTRHAMVDAQVGLGLAGAGAAACFSWMALTSRMPSRRRRPSDSVRPSRAY